MGRRIYQCRNPEFPTFARGGELGRTDGRRAAQSDQDVDRL